MHVSPGIGPIWWVHLSDFTTFSEKKEQNKRFTYYYVNGYFIVVTCIQWNQHDYEFVCSILTHIEAKGTRALPIEKARIFEHVAELKQFIYNKCTYIW